jgi:transglutaminase-like putative cysteine protease
LFLLIPRFGATQWNFPGALGGLEAPSETGYAETIDLNRAGTVKVNDAVALVVRVTDEFHQPKRDLSGEHRWRGMVLDRYSDGRWMNSSLAFRSEDRGLGFEPRFRRPLETAPLSEELPHVGPGQYLVDFAIDPIELGGLVLAEPVLFHPGNRMVPVAPQPGRAPPDVLFLSADWMLYQPRYRNQGGVRYRQVVMPLEEPDLSLPVYVSRMHREQLLMLRGSTLGEWTAQLLRDLAARGACRLSVEDLQYDETGETRVLRPSYHEKVARALTEYLASSGDYTYTLQLRRHDRRMDPTEDFLRNVKQGHCERFAAALALMLRSQGVPCRVVAGFRGAEHLGDGRYAIRYSDAHSWVEVLVPRLHPGGRVTFHWLTLDPTSSIDAPEVPPFSVAWLSENGHRLGQEAWKDFVVEYDIEQQSGLWQGWRGLWADLSWSGVGAWARRLAPLLALGLALLAGVWGARRLWARRPGLAGETVPQALFYGRLLAVLAGRCQLYPAPAQTPREFGAVAGRVLRLIPPASTLAGVPARIVDLFYRVRYGRQPLSAAEQGEVDRQLEQLDAALAGKTAGGR